jgi:hypothetical protein
MTMEERKTWLKRKRQEQEAELERLRAERKAQEEQERHQQVLGQTALREHIKRGQTKALEQGLDMFLSDVPNMRTRQELRLLLIETKRAFLE